VATLALNPVRAPLHVNNYRACTIKNSIEPDFITTDGPGEVVNVNRGRDQLICNANSSAA